eukprot:EG_transcript_51400
MEILAAFFPIGYFPRCPAFLLSSVHDDLPQVIQTESSIFPDTVYLKGLMQSGDLRRMQAKKLGKRTLCRSLPVLVENLPRVLVGTFLRHSASSTPVEIAEPLNLTTMCPTNLK